MAERRMFAKSIIDSDAFLDMPLSTQALYFHLSMRADDEGFINNPKKIMRMVSASGNDMDLLIAKKFIIPFESGIVVIKHWKIHNYIRGDRIIPTNYQTEKEMLTVKENGSYKLTDVRQLTDKCQADDGQVTDKCQHRIGKDRLDKDRLEKRFAPPTLKEVQDYIQEKDYSVNAQEFFDYYNNENWTDSKGQKVKNWKGRLATWSKKEPKRKSNFAERKVTNDDFADLFLPLDGEEK